MAARIGGLILPPEPLAHSARLPAPAQTYRAHIAGMTSSEGVVEGARRRSNAMTSYQRDKSSGDLIARAVFDAATFHDLGKLDPEIQQALRQGRDAKLGWDHIDAGVAHLRSCRAFMAAWIVRAHHAPGLPSLPFHFTEKRDRHLRGRRNDDDTVDRHLDQLKRTDQFLTAMLEAHEASVGFHQPHPGKALHGLPLRLALSCLVDADHSDSAWSDAGWSAPESPAPLWHKRLAALDTYVAGLARGAGKRDELRRAFYKACRDREPDEALVACEGPVGIGKTTAVTAHLLRRAIQTNARRMFIVAPFTAILSQTAECLRKALVLKDERPDTIVAEHHHRADFNDVSSRDLATLWTAPIILTTAVQFFESLSSNAPSALRKLHALPGSVVFLDEAHAALPTHLWPQNWLWLRELADNWSCSFVLASGSLARFWDVDDIVGNGRLTLPELVPRDLMAPLRQAESVRVRYISERFDGPSSLAAAVAAAPGPRLLIMNTVQSAAVMARYMRKEGHDILHISTALSPNDRDLILGTVRKRLDRRSGYSSDWTLVATSIMEAGVDISFRSPFRERFATTSLIQIGGRGNRNFEWPEGVVVRDFVVSHIEGLKAHLAAIMPGNVLADLFERGRFAAEINPAELVTEAMRREMKPMKSLGDNVLRTAEREGRYPEVADYGRVIDADTRLVVVDPVLRNRLIARERLSTREILAGSVQIWANKIELFALDSIPRRPEIFWWPHAYDPAFLGYMAGALVLESVRSGEAFVV